MEMGSVTAWAALLVSFIVFGERIWARMKDQTEDKLIALDQKLDKKVSNIEDSYGGKIEDLTSHKDRLDGANILKRLEEAERRQRDSESLTNRLETKMDTVVDTIAEIKAMMLRVQP